MNPPHALQVLSRGALIGLVATVVDLALLVLLVRSGMPAAQASFPALAVGVGVQFVGSKLFTFEDRSRAWATQGALFLLVEVVAFALNLAIFDVALRALPLVPLPVLRLATTSVVYAGFSLPLWSLVFRRSR